MQIGSYIDRQIISLLVEPMRRDFAVNDTQVSLLLGFAFAVFYAAMAVPIGRMTDRHNRVAIIVISVLFWSVATAGCMIASTYGQLFAARMLVGVGEAALVPAGFSILSDYFRPGRLATATSIMTGASFLGSGCALFFGGAVIGLLPAAAATSIPIVGEVHTWQLAFGFASIPSLIFVFLMIFVREPVRRGAETSAPSATFGEVMQYLAKDKMLWAALFIGMSMLNAYQYGLTTWIPTFFIRAYGWTATEIGRVFGIVFVVFGTVGTVTGGWLCDRLFDRFGRRSFIMTPLISAVLAFPCVIGFAFAPSATVAAVMLAPLTLVGTIAFGAAAAAFPSLAPNRMRAQLVAGYMLVATIVGQGAGPWLIAVYTDYVAGDPALIGTSISVVSPTLLLLAVVILSIATRRIGVHPQTETSASQRGPHAG